MVGNIEVLGQTGSRRARGIVYHLAGNGDRGPQYASPPTLKPHRNRTIRIPSVPQSRPFPLPIVLDCPRKHRAASPDRVQHAICRGFARQKALLRYAALRMTTAHDAAVVSRQQMGLPINDDLESAVQHPIDVERHRL